jgi:geranylgeranyl diphosphate synthase, type I
VSDAAGGADRGLAARLAEFAAAVDEHTREVLDAAALPSHLDGMVRYHLGWVDQRFQPVEAPRGKYLRPALCLLVAEAAGADWRAALSSAAAIELTHNFSLVHDDIEDESPTRRHRPTLWALWGVAQAINAGDTLLILAQLAMLG